MLTAIGCIVSSWFTNWIAFTIVASLLTFIWIIRSKKDNNSRKYPPSPSLRLPIIGHMHHLRKYSNNPWQGFTDLKEKLGDIYLLHMGIQKIVVVSDDDMFREILIQKSNIFANRPDNSRFHAILGGQRENGITFCDTSPSFKVRRNVATICLLPRSSSQMFKYLNHCLRYEMRDFLKRKIIISCDAKGNNESNNSNNNHNNSTGIKTLTKTDLLFMCGNISFHYFCSKRFDDADVGFSQFVDRQEFLLSGIYESFLAEYLPWISKLDFGYTSSCMKQFSDAFAVLVKHVEQTVITPRLDAYMNSKGCCDAKTNGQQGKQLVDHRDSIDILLESHFKDPLLCPWNLVICDTIGLTGGSAPIGSFVMRLLGFLVLHPQVQEAIAKEAKEAIDIEYNSCTKGDNHESQDDVDDRGIAIIDLEHRKNMQMTEACIQETLRITCSPIVPHVATQDTSIAGYDIDKGTIILFNTYCVNLSEDNWPNARVFDPKRFLRQVSEENDDDEYDKEDKKHNNEATKGRSTRIKNVVSKPKHFIPFSVGRRSCPGQQMVRSCAFVIVANLCLRYRLSAQSADAIDQIRDQLSPRGTLVLPPDAGIGDKCFKIIMSPRIE